MTIHVDKPTGTPLRIYEMSATRTPRTQAKRNVATPNANAKKTRISKVAQR